MSTNEALRRSYQNPVIGHGYDLLSWALYAPLGGKAAMREAALDAIGVTAGQRVLELGCGTGGMTERLVARGARVVAVDWSTPMLKLARARAPGAAFVQGEITSFAASSGFDLVLLAFVLHELEPEPRRAALDVAVRALAPGGRVAIVDHQEPARGLLARTVYRVVHSFEPASMTDWSSGGFEPALTEAGLRSETRRELARGTALVVTARLAR